MATELPEEPKSRKEQYLADIAGQDVELPAEPKSREEQYLAYIAENGGGGGGGGTSNFNQLSNRPKYNGTTMTGNTNIPEVKTYTAGTGLSLTGTEFSADTSVLATQNDLSSKQNTLTAGSNITISDNTISATDTTYSAFTGTDGTVAGTAGLVPAPATTDAGKFLKADGTWGTAGGGGSGITVLTSSDYDYPDNNPDGVAMWRLDGGLYTTDGTAKLYFNQSTTNFPSAGKTLLVLKNPSGNSNSKRTVIIQEGGSGATLYETYINNGSSILENVKIASPTVVQTTGNSTTDVMSQDATTSMVFADPGDKFQIQVGRNSLATGAYSVAIGGGNSGEGATTDVLATSSVAIGNSAKTTAHSGVSLGKGATVSGQGGVAIGRGSTASTQGEVNIGSNLSTSYGYNNSNYRLLTGVYDPQSAHDAATKGYVDPTTDVSAPTTATVGRLGQIQIDTTNADAYMCVAVDTVTPSYTWKKINA